MSQCKMLGLLLLVHFSISPCFAKSDCVVSNFQVKENFNKTRYAGKWHAFAKKDPVGIFLESNIHAEFKIENETMTAKAIGLVTLLPEWIVCAEMMGTFNNTEDPAKFKLKYWGAAEHLQKGNDDHWIIDTDYDNYAITYTCRKLNDNGTCADSYSFVFSRDLKGLTSESQRVVRKWQDHLCLAYRYRRVAQTGACP
ncbi:retinol-binding protein 4 [Scyliorhinus canicula]|uniref:retinol-binding protein 4 n=1 Tax=Scyliorhinus canicula TaxID=7830 RepID=UPI0018F67921|nr:retinol-binding protein 4 [Scyliorhinus canicula]XP_038629188.1 retinol-binding protein 4 [Scyliorhinus canicula]XP_038629189.1 retinol-binding protein 4 [Scyliorhinus canicula]XP_038629190.1 retinol-binding protein 4 [Scyliorhinus canicula]XP_038629191.1 retinol-binding protein 4 [Scyliorhinus canicula]